MMKTYLTGMMLTGMLLLSLPTEVAAQQPMYPPQGIWQWQYNTYYGVAREQLVLMHNGTFTKYFRCSDKAAYFSGRYLVGPGFIRFYHDRGPIRTETMWVQFDGPNKMYCSDRITGGRWVAYRVGP